MASDKAKSLEAGMVQHITKPIDPVELFSALLTWIEPKDTTLLKSKSVGRASKQQKNKTHSFMEIPGIDIEKGLFRTLGKEELYKNILIQFHDEYADTAIKIKKAIESKEEKNVLSSLHAIKGLAGSIGADDLFYAAMELEAHLKSKNYSGINNNFNTFNRALKTVIDAIETIVIPTADMTPEIVEKNVGRPELLIQLLIKLKPYILNREPKPSEKIINSCATSYNYNTFITTAVRSSSILKNGVNVSSDLKIASSISPDVFVE